MDDQNYILADMSFNDLEYLTREQVLDMVDEYGNYSCHHNPGDVRYGDPTFAFGRCSACWRSAWPVILVADRAIESGMHKHLTAAVDAALDAALYVLRQRWYASPDGIRLPTHQDKERADAIKALKSNASS